MISQAEVRGEISVGDTLIEATSGNTGIALAMVAVHQWCVADGLLYGFVYYFLRHS
jgi:hypothetical protein